MAGRSLRTSLIFMPSLLVAACASEPVPESLSAARLQVGQMTMATTPESQVYLQAARDKLAAAERAAADDDMKRADYLATEALANVKVAQATVQAAQAEAAAQDVERAIQALRAETAPRAGTTPPTQPQARQ